MTVLEIKLFNTTEITDFLTLKNQYRKLTLQYHPDVNADGLELMKQVNAEYEEIFNMLDRGITPAERKAKSIFDKIDDGYREILEKVIFLDELEIELCGSWLWIGGNTKKHYTVIKEAGFKFSAKKVMWYWHGGLETATRKHYRGKYSMNEIRNMHGSTKVQSEERQKIAG